MVVIFGSAALIWVYNLVQGRNLAKPPVFDLSIYSEMRLPSPDEVFKGAWIEEDQLIEKQLETESVVPNDKADDFVYQFNSLYFTRYFTGKTPDETNKNIKNFVNDFPWLASFEIRDLAARKCFVVVLTLAPEKRGATLSWLKSEPSVASVEPSSNGAPEFDLCFKADQYRLMVEEFLIDNNVTLVEPEKPMEYAAVINLGDGFVKYKTELDLLQKEYSDVVKVVGGEL